MLEVKVSSRGSGRDLNISQFVGNDENVWSGCRFHINSSVDEADVWLIIEDVDDDDTDCRVPSESVIFLSAETSWPPGFYDTNARGRAFLDQFAWIYTCHDIYRANVTADFPFLPWMVNANHGPSVSSPHERNVNQLAAMHEVTKTRDLSVICSQQSLTATHRMRLRFVEALKEHFGDRLDWYGNGVQPIAEKWDGLAPYKYSIAIENHVAWNVATEKIWDPYLSLTFPVYAGAPNIGEVVPEESFLAIDVKDFPGSVEKIESLLADDPYESLLPALRNARDVVTGPMNLYSRLANIAHRHSMGGPRENISLLPYASGQVGTQPGSSMLKTLGEQINKVGDLLVQRGLRRED